MSIISPICGVKRTKRTMGTVLNVGKGYDYTKYSKVQIKDLIQQLENRNKLLKTNLKKAKSLKSDDFGIRVIEGVIIQNEQDIKDLKKALK